MDSLRDTIAVVTGASRGAGRGIAYELGRSGATVYVTGRSTQESSTDGRPETIEQTAAGVTARGGLGIPVRCDHTDPDEITCLFQQIQDQHGQIDLLVNSVFGGSEASLPAGQGKRFWERPPEHWDAMMVAGPKAYLLTTRAAVPLLQQSSAALIINLTSFTPDQAAGNLYYDLAMQASATMRPKPPLTSDELSLPSHRIRIFCNGPGKLCSWRTSRATTASRTRTERSRRRL